MYKKILFFSFLIILVGCQNNSTQPQSSGKTVKDATELNTAIENAKAGDQIILANGTWKDVEIKFIGQGTKEKPIILRAETAGEVFIEGKSNLKFGGEVRY